MNKYYFYVHFYLFKAPSVKAGEVKTILLIY